MTCRQPHVQRCLLSLRIRNSQIFAVPPGYGIKPQQLARFRPDSAGEMQKQPLPLYPQRSDRRTVFEHFKFSHTKSLPHILCGQAPGMTAVQRKEPENMVRSWHPCFAQKGCCPAAAPFRLKIQFPAPAPFPAAPTATVSRLIVPLFCNTDAAVFIPLTAAGRS